MGVRGADAGISRPGFDETNFAGFLRSDSDPGTRSSGDESSRRLWYSFSRGCAACDGRPNEAESDFSWL